MSQVFFDFSAWTAADLVVRFGPIPLHRIVQDPPPGSATVEDVVRMDAHEDRLCELIDGTLVEKTMGAWESYLGIQIIVRLNEFVTAYKLGIVLGADGMMQIFPKQVRIPDASFLSWNTLKSSGFPDKPVPHMTPDLAVEVISENNTREEMDRKVREYFAAGSRLVWYVYPDERQVHVYVAPDRMRVLAESEELTGGEVLPGFLLKISALFAKPQQP